MFDALTAGNLVAGPDGGQVDVTSGLLTASVDSGPGVFDGEAYWLEVSRYCRVV